MKVLLNAIDSASKAGPFPNLAVMKLSAWHKVNGDEVALVGKGLENQDQMKDPDVIYISCVFDWNRREALAQKRFAPNTKHIIGGSGIDLHNRLPEEAESMSPDYSLYDNRGVKGWPYAIGFSSRGCNRKCPWCIVPTKEGKLTTEWTHSIERLTRNQSKLVLLDNNFMQDPDCEKKLDWLMNWRGFVCFSQGIDIRIIAERPDLAKKLAKTHYRSLSFKTKIITSAFDFPQMDKIVKKGCKVLEAAGFHLRYNVQFFVLCNYNTTFEEDLYRVNLLRDIGTNPFVMVYDKKHASNRINHLQRWCNLRQLFWSATWEDLERPPGTDVDITELQTWK